MPGVYAPPDAKVPLLAKVRRVVMPKDFVALAGGPLDDLDDRARGVVSVYAKGRDYHDVLKAEKVGERKVRFTFRDASNKELPLIVGQLPVLPSKWWANRDFEKVSLEIPLGSGPYRVDSFDVGRSIAYRRVDDWWAKDLWMNRGRNNFDVIRYEYYRDVTVQFEAFKAGDLDLRQENIARNWATAYDIPAVRDGRIQRAEIAHELPTGMQCFSFNTRRDLFKDRRVREAIAPNRLHLTGSHRFSDYSLVWKISEQDSGQSELSATTRARFPGLHGRAYKAMVIDSGAHARITRRMLTGVGRRATRS